jgi:hypothetical protein
MKPILLIIPLALALLMFIGTDTPVIASSEFLSAQGTPDTQMIRTLQRTSKESNQANAEVRDPFAVPPTTAAPTEQATASFPPVLANTAPPVPDFRILGKQEDDDGWAVFISDAEKPGEVWVVREGEAFNDNFRVSKLAPPLLIIKNTRSRQSRTFNIGKDEE